jgi:hypothetical protein
MAHRSFWNVSALATAASVVLASCGGGIGEIVAAVAFIGSAGGDWRADGNSTLPGLQQRSDCGATGNADCTVNITAVDAPNLYASAFDVIYSGTMPGCPASSTQGGRIDRRRINLPGCFVGEYVTINEALSDSGADRMFFDFTPPMDEGIWVEIQDGQRRFQFTTTDDDGTTATSTGCEFSAGSRPVATVVLNKSKIAQAGGPFETTIASFTIAGDAGGAWSGRFVGISGMRLTRGSEELELERRNQAASPACPP